MKPLKQKLNIASLALLILIFGSAFSHSALASEINAENIVKYVNAAREKEGLANLKVSPKLTEVATLKVNDMVANKYFAHTSPAGISPWYWFEKDGYDYKYAGENLAINFITAEDEQSAWMNSPTHRKNILNVNYEEIGVAVAAGEVNGQVGIIAVQEFGTLAKTAQAGSDAKNFSAQNKNDLMTKDTSFTPSVLSGKDVSLKSKSAEPTDLKTDLLAGKAPLDDSAWNFVLVLMLILIMAPIMLVQPVVISRFLKTSWFKVATIKK
jgi:uncharacterized protein YkwD